MLPPPPIRHAGDAQRAARIIDEDGVHLVYDCHVQWPLQRLCGRHRPHPVGIPGLPSCHREGSPGPLKQTAMSYPQVTITRRSVQCTAGLFALSRVKSMPLQPIVSNRSHLISHRHLNALPV